MLKRMQNRKTEVALMNVGLGTRWYLHLFDIVYVVTGITLG